MPTTNDRTVNTTTLDTATAPSASAPRRLPTHRLSANWKEVCRRFAPMIGAEKRIRCLRVLPWVKSCARDTPPPCYAASTISERTPQLTRDARRPPCSALRRRCGAPDIAAQIGEAGCRRRREGSDEVEVDAGRCARRGGRARGGVRAATPDGSASRRGPHRVRPLLCPPGGRHRTMPGRRVQG